MSVDPTLQTGTLDTSGVGPGLHAQPHEVVHNVWDKPRAEEPVEEEVDEANLITPRADEPEPKAEPKTEEPRREGHRTTSRVDHPTPAAKEREAQGTGEKAEPVKGDEVSGDGSGKALPEVEQPVPHTHAPHHEPAKATRKTPAKAHPQSRHPQSRTRASKDKE